MSLVCLFLYLAKTIRLINKIRETISDWLFVISGGEQLNEPENN